MNHVVVERPFRWQELIQKERHEDNGALRQIVSRGVQRLKEVLGE